MAGGDNLVRQAMLKAKTEGLAREVERVKIEEAKKAEESAQMASAKEQYKTVAQETIAPITARYEQIAAPSNTNVDPAFRQYQLGLAQQLQAQANGQGESIAQLQLKQATDQGLAQSLGAIRSATGANAGLAARTAGLAGAQQLGQAGNTSAVLRLQEQQDAQKLLGNLITQGRQGDISATGQRLSTELGAANGMTDLAGMSINPYAQIYSTDSKEIAEQQRQREDRERERRARNNSTSDKILGAVVNAGATALGTYTMGPAGGAIANEATKPKK